MICCFEKLCLPETFTTYTEDQWEGLAFVLGSSSFAPDEKWLYFSFNRPYIRLNLVCTSHSKLYLKKEQNLKQAFANNQLI